MVKLIIVGGIGIWHIIESDLPSKTETDKE